MHLKSRLSLKPERRISSNLRSLDAKLKLLISLNRSDIILFSIISTGFKVKPILVFISYKKNTKRSHQNFSNKPKKANTITPKNTKAKSAIHSLKTPSVILKSNHSTSNNTRNFSINSNYPKILKP